MQVTHQILSNPVARGLDILGDRWSILILREVFLGRRRFAEFRHNTGISRGTLSKRLETLVFHGLLYKNPYQMSPLRLEYRLTDKGLGLSQWALLVWTWELQWNGAAEELNREAELYHPQGTEHRLSPVAVCRHCRELLHLDDVERVVNPDAKPASAAELKAFGEQRRNRSLKSDNRKVSQVADIIGDRWILLLLAAAFIGLCRYEDFRQQLGIATNILADRLKVLVDIGVFEKHVYRAQPQRYEYKLTEKGKSLYPQTMALRQWVLDWLPEVAHPFKLIHRNCNLELAIDVICEGCAEDVSADQILLKRPS